MSINKGVISVTALTHAWSNVWSGVSKFRCFPGLQHLVDFSTNNAFCILIMEQRKQSRAGKVVFLKKTPMFCSWWHCVLKPKPNWTKWTKNNLIGHHRLADRASITEMVVGVVAFGCITMLSVCGVLTWSFHFRQNYQRRRGQRLCLHLKWRQHLWRVTEGCVQS